MFEYIRLKNFKSFGNVEFNMLDRYNEPKKMVLIYGENGIGKSNLASAFFMLSETLRTMDVRDLMESIFAENAEKIKDPEEFKKFFRTRYKDMETLIKENKTVASDEPMYMEFGFRLNEKSGKYIIETDNSQIIHERLEYILIKNRGVYFDITPDKISITEKIFSDKTAYQTIKNSCEKFWGKHSLIAILMHESEDKADQYIKKQIKKNFGTVLTFFSQISCKIKFGSRQERGIIGLPHEILGKYESGEINREDESLLDKSEKMLNDFLKLTYRDIQKAYYKKTTKDDTIQYQLMLTKNIAGTTREIDFSLESTGTQSLIQQLPFMLVVVEGSVAVIDEFDTGIHDILVRSLASSLYSNITGQLIMTTHNTLLMESDIPKECIYVINELSNGDKEVECILHYNNKIGESNNIRNQYLLGRYSGIPAETKIDFRQLLSSLYDDDKL